MIAPGDILVITGIMAAGKSTIAQALTELWHPSVHLRGDVFRRMIVNGQEPVTPENWSAAERQLHLRYDLAATAALRYAAAGFIVCYQDVIIGPDLSRVVDLLASCPGSIFVVVLAPNAAVAMARDRGRHKTTYGEWTPEELAAGLQAETPRIGLWLDTSELSVAQTVQTILARLDEARIAIAGDG
jgi:chloramphenicol 3-O-phosphotransferase